MGRESWRRGFHTVGNPSQVCLWWVLEFQRATQSGRKEKKHPPPTHTHLTVKLQVETEKWPDTHGHHQRVGTRQGGVGYLIGPLGVRTGPECPEDNLRELMWDSNPNHGIIGRERERETFPTTGSSIARWTRAHSQTKGVRESYRRASRRSYRALPPQRRRGRSAIARAWRQAAAAILGPRDRIFHQTVSRLPVVHHIFLGSWTADIWHKYHSLRSDPQKRHTAQLRLGSRGTPRKLSGWNQGGE